VIVNIKTIDFPDDASSLTIVGMETNLYALEMLTAERLTHAREEAQRLGRLARARPRHRSLRVRFGCALIALGEWLRGRPVLSPGFS
jgi:hypothetical protein